MARRLALGRGMKQLIPDVPEDDIHKILNLDVDLIKPNPNQPRKTFDQQHLDELAASIRENGIIQPIVVTRNGKEYQIIAGERRWRASQLAGYEKIPAVLKSATEEEALIWALIENIQRKDLNPIEEAMAYKEIMDQQGMTQEAMGKKLGKNRARIANTIRLLKLPVSTKKMIQEKKLSFGHARCLAAVDKEEDILKLAADVINKGLSVRALEKKIQDLKKSLELKKEKVHKKDPFIKNAEKNMSKFVGMKVIIKGNHEKGMVSIPYLSEDELQRVYECLTVTEVNSEY